MQNYNAPPPGQPAYGAPPPAKRGISKGCLIAIVVAVVLAVGAVVVLVLGGVGVYYFSQGSGGNVSVTSNTSGGTGGPTTSGGDDEAEGPAPTAAQTAAISGGQSARWEQQEMEWTVPQRWNKLSADSTTFTWRSPGSEDAANLIVNVSPMRADFPADISTQSYYDSAVADKQNGKYDEVRWLKLGNVKGVLFRESAPEQDDGIRRLQWIGYRDYKGQKQYVSIMLSTEGKYFARHEDALYGVMYSTKF